VGTARLPSLPIFAPPLRRRHIQTTRQEKFDFLTLLHFAIVLTPSQLVGVGLKLLSANLMMDSVLHLPKQSEVRFRPIRVRAVFGIRFVMLYSHEIKFASEAIPSP
jgi:hypothetical protein